jgi:hypothetical protein
MSSLPLEQENVCACRLTQRDTPNTSDNNAVFTKRLRWEKCEKQTRRGEGPALFDPLKNP